MWVPSPTRGRWVFNPKERMAEGMGWIASLSLTFFVNAHAKGASQGKGVVYVDGEAGGIGGSQRYGMGFFSLKWQGDDTRGCEGLHRPAPNTKDVVTEVSERIGEKGALVHRVGANEGMV
jgi:hypothetical protein